MKKNSDILIKVLSLGVGLAVGIVLIAKVFFELSYDSFYKDIDRVYTINTWYSHQGEARMRYSLTWTKARMMAMLAAIATSLFSKPESMATPCSVKAKGGAESFLLDDIIICDDILRTSSTVNWNIKSGGSLFRFLLTDWFNTRVSTWYNLARSKSSITFFPRNS